MTLRQPALKSSLASLAVKFLAVRLEKNRFFNSHWSVHRLASYSNIVVSEVPLIYGIVAVLTMSSLCLFLWCQ